MTNTYIISGILVMAITTYIIRMLPMIIFRKKIENRFIKSFLHYVPYVVITAMTFPAIFSSTNSVISASVGALIAIILAYKDKSLLTVALGASIAVYVVELFI